MKNATANRIARVAVYLYLSIMLILLCFAGFQRALAEGPMPVEAPRTEAFVIDLTAIIQACVALMAAFVTHRLIPWIKAKTSNEQQGALMLAVKTCVYAAEQLYKNEKDNGSLKLRYVEDMLQKQGYKVDRNAIEAMVTELRHSGGVIIETAELKPAFDGEPEDEDEEPPIIPANPAS